MLLATPMPDLPRVSLAIMRGTGRQPRGAAHRRAAPDVQIQTIVYGLKNLAT